MVYNRKNRLVSEKFHENITKRGQASAAEKKKKIEGDLVGPRISPAVVGVLLFVVFGR